jgi:hypothetical protein
MIIFIIVFLILLITLGYIVSKNKKSLCTLCEKDSKNTFKVNDQVNLCSMHHDLYNQADLRPFLSVHCTPSNYESGVFLYGLFKSIVKNNIYCHIITEYELNAEHIETKQTLFVDYNNVSSITVLTR